MTTVKLCRNCWRLPMDDMHFDYTINLITYRMYCPCCGMTSMNYTDKEDAILDWNERCKTK